jgi:hypothetical protein
MDEKCGQCKKKLNLVESTIKCRCGFSFCTKHRDFQKHECSFDFKEYETGKLRAQLEKTANCVELDELSWNQWHERYEKQHISRMVRTIHSLAFVSGILYFCSAIIFWVLHIRQSLLFWLIRSLVVSIMVFGMGKLLSWFLSDNSCKMCMCSIEMMSNPRFAWNCEVETLKENIAFVLSASKTNCMTRDLYTGERTFQSIYNIASKKTTAKLS